MSAAANNQTDTSTVTDYPKLRKQALAVGIIGLILAGIGFMQGVNANDARPLFGWLIGLVYWLNIGIGMLFLIIIFYLFDAGWPIIIRRQLEHAVSGFKWLAIIFLPLMAVSLGYIGDDVGLLWRWLNEGAQVPGGHGTVGEDVLYLHKKAYLNESFFAIRYVLYFAVWIGLSAILRKCSYALDRDGNAKWAHLARKISTVGVFLCAFAATFASIDWFMSIEYHWFSTMYGVWFFAEGMRSSLAMIVVLLYFLSRKGYLQGIIKQVHFYYIGCLMLAFTVFWAYISFSQYFLIYNANIPEETFWYHLREFGLDGNKNTWWWVSMSLVFGQFLVPFLCLLWYPTKIKPTRLVKVAVWMLIMHMVDLYWNILPGKVIDGESQFGYVLREFSVTWYDVAMVVGVGGIMLWSFLREAAQQKAIPVRDPRITESINAHE